MTVRYVGPGGADGNSGLTWALRKETLNGVEDTPVVANDIIYVGAGTYRETLTCDVSGSSGNEIVYIADITGENTDGIGGIIRITGYDSDTGTPQRNTLIVFTGRTYRTFRGFVFDGNIYGPGGPFGPLQINSGQNIIVEDCVFGESYRHTNSASWGGSGIGSVSGTGSSNTVRRGFFMPMTATPVCRKTTGDVSADVTFENVFFFSPTISVDGILDTKFHKCTAFALGGLQNTEASTELYDSSLLWVLDFGIAGAIDDYNISSKQGSLTGSNNVYREVVTQMPILFDGVRFPVNMSLVQPFSSDTVRRSTGQGVTEDMYGLAAMPSTNGFPGSPPIVDVVRETTTVTAGLTSIEIPDAGIFHFLVPVIPGERHSVRVDVYRETDHAGTNPQVVLHRTGYADVTLTDAGSSAQWNTLTTSFNADAGENFIGLEFRSNNTASSGSFKAYFDGIRLRAGNKKDPRIKWAHKYMPVDQLLFKSSEDSWVFASLPMTPFFGETVGPLPLFRRR